MKNKKSNVWNKFFAGLIALTIAGVAYVGVVDNKKFSIAGRGTKLSDTERVLNKEYYDETGQTIEKLIKEIVEANSKVKSFRAETHYSVNEKEFTEGFDHVNHNTRDSLMEFNITDESLSYFNNSVYNNIHRPDTSLTTKKYEFLNDQGSKEYTLEVGLDKYVLEEDPEAVMPEVAATELTMIEILLTQVGVNSYIESYDDDVINIGVLLSGDDASNALDLYSIGRNMEVEALEDGVAVDNTSKNIVYKLQVDRDTLLARSVELDATEYFKDMAEQINIQYENDRYEVTESKMTVKFMDLNGDINIVLPGGVEGNTYTTEEYFKIKDDMAQEQVEE